MTTAHLWCDNRSTSINACGECEGQGLEFKSLEGVLHTYTIMACLEGGGRRENIVE